MRLISSICRAKFTLQQLSLLSGNLARCLAAGLDIPKSLLACQRSSENLLLREVISDAAKQTAVGMSLHDALLPHQACFPAFFVPAIRCGEESGHLDQALLYVENHCRLLVRPTRALRNMWFVPLCLMLGGTVICAAAHCVIAPWARTMHYILDSLQFYLYGGAAVAAVVYIPPLRALCDELMLAVPIIGPAQRELATNRFFHAMNLLYTTGGRRVEAMIRLAADSAGNRALRSDFLRAAEAIVAGSTIGEAFSAVACLPFHYKAAIVAGDESGKLEESLDSICRESSERVVSLLTGFQSLYFRMVALATMLSIVGTFQSLAPLLRR